MGVGKVCVFKEYLCFCLF